MKTLWSVNAGFNSAHPRVTLEGSKVDPTEAWEMEDNVRTSRHAFSKCRHGLGREGLSKVNVARTRPYGVIRSLAKTGFYPLGKMFSIERPLVQDVRDPPEVSNVEEQVILKLLRMFVSVKLRQYDTPRRCWNRFNYSHASSLGGLNRYLPAGGKIEERVVGVDRSRLLSLTR